VWEIRVTQYPLEELESGLAVMWDITGISNAIVHSNHTCFQSQVMEMVQQMWKLDAPGPSQEMKRNARTVSSRVEAKCL
jgi:hypothetical protein